MRPNQRMHRTFASGLRAPATAGDARRYGHLRMSIESDITERVNCAAYKKQFLSVIPSKNDQNRI